MSNICLRIATAAVYAHSLPHLRLYFYAAFLPVNTRTCYKFNNWYIYLPRVDLLLTYLLIYLRYALILVNGKLLNGNPMPLPPTSDPKFTYLIRVRLMCDSLTPKILLFYSIGPL